MKSVVITGSTRGIGLGLAREYLKRGCQVTVSGRSAQSVDKALAELSPFADRVHGIACEVTSFEQVQALWDGAVERFGRVDIWISNAGVANDERHLPVHEMRPETLATVVDINLVGSMYCARVAIAGMHAQPGGGFYYNFEGYGSNGKMFQTGMTPYATTKCAIRYFTKALSKEVKGTDVKVGALSPGIVITDLILGQYEDRPEDLERVKKIFNILADRVETVTPFLVEKTLQNQKNGTLIEWLTTRKAMGRFMTAGFRKRDLFSDRMEPPAPAGPPPRLVNDPPPASEE